MIIGFDGDCRQSRSLRVFRIDCFQSILSEIRPCNFEEPVSHANWPVPCRTLLSFYHLIYNTQDLRKIQNPQYIALTT